MQLHRLKKVFPLPFVNKKKLFLGFFYSSHTRHILISKRRLAQQMVGDDAQLNLRGAFKNLC
jgi:hypothetical protein